MRLVLATTMPPLDDIPIVRGEPFDQFYAREYRPILGLAYVLSGNISAAEELTQDAFEAALRQWPRLINYDDAGAWIRRVIANRSVSLMRKRVAEAKALFRSRTSGLGDRPLNQDELIDIWQEVRRLPKRQAQVIALVYLSDLPRRQVAEILGCSEETVKTHLDRARQTLADRLRLGDSG